MAEEKSKDRKHRTDRELRILSFNEKLKFAVLAALGLPLLALINVVFVLRVIDLFSSDSLLGFIGLLAFALIIGIAAIGADYWLARWFIEEFNVFRWISRGNSAEPRGDDQ